jgi:hypothetical protein
MKNFLVLIAGMLSLFGLAGCVANSQALHRSPGDVLGEMSGKIHANKIVVFTVVGKGIEPEAGLTRGQARLMAERAAVADGYRQFVEKIRGVYVDAYMRAGYGAVNLEKIKTSTRSWLRGVEVVEIKQGILGIVEAHMQLRINFIQNNMIWWPVGLGDNITASR